MGSAYSRYAYVAPQPRDVSRRVGLLVARPRKVKRARIARPNNPHRTYSQSERVSLVAKIAATVAQGFSVEAACGMNGIHDKTLRNWYADNPGFRDRVHASLDVSLAKRRSRAEAVVQMCMDGDDRQLALKAATFFLETQCGWQRGPSVAVTVGDRRRHVIHTDMTEIRARADANAAAQTLIEETAVPSA